MTVTVETSIQADTLGHRIRTLRLRSGVTIETAARTSGVCITTWRNWEAGRKQPRLFRGNAIASALGVPIGALYRDDVVADVVVSEETVQRIRTSPVFEARSRAAACVCSRASRCSRCVCRGTSDGA